VDAKKRKRLEQAGWKFGDAGDFLGLTDAERKLVELRLAVSRAVRKRREESGETQQQLAEKMNSSQPRVVKIEAGTIGVSLDLSFHALFAAGGCMEDLEVREDAGRKRGPRMAVPKEEEESGGPARVRSTAGKARARGTTAGSSTR
jgi:transcriptional regulator with XRE-family HTH domain